MSAGNLNKGKGVQKVQHSQVWLLGLRPDDRELSKKWGVSSVDAFNFEKERREKLSEKKDKKSKQKD